MKYLSLLILLLAGGGLTAQIDHWETLVFEDDEWHYLVPDQAVDADWTRLDYDDAHWPTGRGGFGYGDGDDRTELPPTLSCFLRRKFTVTDKTLIRQLYWQLDYDDAILVYLNGEPVVRRNLHGHGPVAHDHAAATKREAALYNGQATDQAFLAGHRLQQLLRDGENVLSVQVHNYDLTSSDLSARVWLHAAVATDRRDYRPTPEAFSLPILTDSNLPIIMIDTPGDIPDEPKIDGTMRVIHHLDGARNFVGDHGNEYEGHVGIEVRGSTSAHLFAKKSFSLETRDAQGENRNVSLFGMPAENDWALHGPFSDKTLIRNVLTMELGRRTGRWAPRTQFCELVVNGDYRGVYVFMEKIKRDEGRVDISKLQDDDNEGDELTGGYIIKLDKATGGDEVAWSSPYGDGERRKRTTDYLLHYPKLEDITPNQLDYIQNYVTDFEHALFSDDPTNTFTGYRQYLDVPSFVDYLLITELCRNVDGYRISTYFYKQKDSKGGKLSAGPLWDYNIAWGNADYCDGNGTSGWQLDYNAVCPGDVHFVPAFWRRMIAVDTAFANALHCRWRELRDGPWRTEALLDFIDEQTTLLAEAQERNLRRWPEMARHVWPNPVVGASYADEIAYLKNWTLQRLAFLDAEMFGSCGGDTASGDALVAQAYPNPARTHVNFVMYGIGRQLFIYNGTGHLVHRQVVLDPEVRVDVSGLPAGLYYYAVGNRDNLSTRGKFVVSGD